VGCFELQPVTIMASEKVIASVIFCILGWCAFSMEGYLVSD